MATHTDAHTRSNRATYDRIAARYAENQDPKAKGYEPWFAELERDFVRAVPVGGLVADVGCGPAFDGGRMADAGFRVVGVDLSAGMLAIAAERLAGRTAQADLRALPVATGHLDGIWCAAALLHVAEADTSIVLDEFARALCRGGSLALVTALGEGAAFEAVPYATEEQRWFVYRRRETLTRQLQAAGFGIRSAVEIDRRRLWLAVLAEATDYGTTS